MKNCPDFLHNCNKTESSTPKLFDFIAQNLEEADQVDLPDYGKVADSCGPMSWSDIYEKHVPIIIMPNELMAFNYNFPIESRGYKLRIPMILLCKQLEDQIALFVLYKNLVDNQWVSVTKQANLINAEWVRNQIMVSYAESNMKQDEHTAMRGFVNHSIDLLLGYLFVENTKASTETVS